MNSESQAKGHAVLNSPSQCSFSRRLMFLPLVIFRSRCRRTSEAQCNTSLPFSHPLVWFLGPTDKEYFPTYRTVSVEQELEDTPSKAVALNCVCFPLKLSRTRRSICLVTFYCSVNCFFGENAHEKETKSESTVRVYDLQRALIWYG